MPGRSCERRHAPRHQSQADRRRHRHRRAVGRALSALYVARLSSVVLHESQARGQLLAQRHLSPRPRSGAGERRSRTPRCATTRAARDPRVEHLRRERHRRRRSSIATGIVVASSDTDARRPAAAAERRPRAARHEAAPLEQLRVIYSQRRPDARGAPADDRSATRRSARFAIGVSTLLMRQELNASLHAGAGHGGRRAASWPCSSRRCWRSCCCGRFT